MSKGLGRKIAIRFTESLLGDDFGKNPPAFTVTGQEYKHVNGPMITKTYQIDSVERYPVTILNEEDFQDGIADGVQAGANGLVLEEVYIPVSILETFTQPGSDSFTVPAGVTRISALVVAGGGGGGSRQGGGGGAGGLVFETDISVTADDEISVTVGAGGAGGTNGGCGTNGGNSSFNTLVAVGGGSGGGRTTNYTGANGGSGGGGAASQSGGVGTQGQGYAGGTGNPAFSNSGGGGGGASEKGGDALNTSNQINNKAGDGGDGINLSSILGTGIGDDGWFAGGGGGAHFGNDNPSSGGKGGGADGTASSDAYARIPGKNGTANTGGGGGGSFSGTDTGGSGGSGIVIVYTGGYEAFIASGTYIVPFDASALTVNPRIKWTADTPTGTAITVDYKCNDTNTTPPASWIEAADDGVLNIDDDYLWLRYTLETTDTAVTPTLTRAWLEEPDAPQDIILLTMNPQGRFNNVVGNLTVSYDHTVGNLQGRGGFVESFTKSFAPADLVPFPQPNAEQGTITAEVSTTMAFIHIDYKRRYAEESVTVSPACTMAFLNVEDVNP